METAVVIRRVLKSGIGSGNCCSICAILPVKGNDKHIKKHTRGGRSISKSRFTTKLLRDKTAKKKEEGRGKRIKRRF